MMDFHFIRPWWFLALVPLAIMLWQLNRYKHHASGWQQIIPAHLVNHLIQGQSVTKHQPFWLLALAWTIAVIALAGPTWEKLPQPVYQTNTGKVLVMDMSMSMRSSDLKPDRLTKARFKAIDLIDRIDDADMGLVAYSGDAFVISPLTNDSKNLTALIPSLSPEIMPVDGSDPVAGLQMADNLLKNAGYVKGEIFLLTDGIEQFDLEVINEFIKTSEHRISVLGIGTVEGAPIKLTTGQLLKDRRGSIVIPKLNDAPLRAIAQNTGGVYSRITNTDADIKMLAAQQAVSREAKKEEEQLHQGDQYKEFGPYLVLLILPFAAYAFRRGLVVCLVLSFSLLQTPTAEASWWNDLWKTKDQQAQQQYNQESYADAAATFKDEQWRGSSLYKSGDYEGALAEYKKSNTADGLYNQGNAHARLAQIDEAIEAYEKALELSPDMVDAQKNLELLKQLKDQQQKQQEQDQEKKDQENQDQQQNQDQQGQGEGEQDEQEQSEEDGQSQQDSGEQDQQENENDPQSGQKDKDGEGEKDPQGRDAEQEKEQDEMQQQKKPGQEKDDENKEGMEEQQARPSDKEMTNEQKEQMQEIQQLLRKIPDDPSKLLRNKMRLEYQKRKYQQTNSPPGEKSW